MGNRVFAILCAGAVISASCTKVRNYEKPPVQDYGLTIVSARINPIEIEGLGRLNDHKWVESDTIGIYGSEKGSNVAYVPCQDGSLDRFCGDIVKGRLNLYYPYEKGGCKAAEIGRMPLKSVVQYSSDPSAFVFSNMTFVSDGEGNDFNFKFPVGMVKMSIALNVPGCRAVSITVNNISEGYDQWICGDFSINGSVYPIINGEKTLTVTAIGGTDVTEEHPLDLYFAAPPSRFENLIITIGTDHGDPIVQACKGPLEIREGCLTSCKVVEFKPGYSLDAYGSEAGSLN